MKSILQNKACMIYKESNQIKNSLSEENFLTIAKKLFVNPESIEPYYLDYEFILGIDSYFSNYNNTILFLKDLEKQKVISLKRLIKCEVCKYEKITDAKKMLDDHLYSLEEDSENFKVDFTCDNCLNVSEINLSPNLENNVNQKEYDLVFYFTKEYTDLMKEEIYNIEVDKSSFSVIFNSPFKTRVEYLKEKENPFYAKIRDIEIRKKNPLNFSVWNPPMENMLKDNKTIKTITSYFFFLTPELLEDLYEGKTKRENDFLSLIPKEWFEKENVFIRTGAFSNKFQFNQPHVKNMEKEVYDSYMSIAYQALMVGADKPTEVVLREFIENKGNRPTIYHGMPLNTEFRYFYDFDKKEFLGVANYWHPELMIPSLENNAMYDKTFSEDLEVYKKTMGAIEKEFKEEKDALANYLENSLLRNNEENGYKFKGVWSIDIMKSGDEYYFIDMAVGERSALSNQMEEIIPIFTKSNS